VLDVGIEMTDATLTDPQEIIAIDVVPIQPPTDDGLPFAYDVSMGVRRSDAALRDRLDEVIARRHNDIDRLLASYGVPRVAKAQEQ
jgi:mxaJ protein